VKNLSYLADEMEEWESTLRGVRKEERVSAPSLSISYRGEPGELGPDDDVVAAKTWPDGSITYMLRGGNIIYEKH